VGAPAGYGILLNMLCAQLIRPTWATIAAARLERAAPLAPAPAAPETETLTQPDLDVERLQRTLARLLPPYKVLLHNDDHNSMGHVVHALRRVVPALSRTDALRIMFEAHTKGTAVVIVCPREPAEHYRDGLRSYGLVSTIEPDR